MAEDVERPQAPAPVADAVERRPNFISRLLHRKSQPSNPVEADAAKQQPAIKAGEKAKTPEVLQQEIGAGLEQLCDLRDKIIAQKIALSRLARVDQSAMTEAQKSYSEVTQAELKKALGALEENLAKKSADTVLKLEGAKSVLGDFCVVIEEGDHKTAILLSPLQKRRTISVTSNDPLDETRFKGPPPALYTKTENFYEVFSINNREGVGKSEVVTGITVDNIRPDLVGMKGSFDAQDWLFRVSRSNANDAFYALLNGRKILGETDGFRTYDPSGRVMFNALKNRLLGIGRNPTGRNDQMGIISARLGDGIPSPQGLVYSEVTFAPEVLGALNLSISGAERKLRQTRPGTWARQDQNLYIDQDNP